MVSAISEREDGMMRGDLHFFQIDYHGDRIIKWGNWKMAVNNKKSKVNIETLSQMTQREFSAVRKEMTDMATNMATNMASKEDLHELKHEIIDEVRKENQKMIHSNDRIVTKLDTFLKEDAAHKMAHDRVEETVEGHETRIKKLEGVMKVA